MPRCFEFQTVNIDRDNLDTIKTFDLTSENWTTAETLFNTVERPATTEYNNIISQH